MDINPLHKIDFYKAGHYAQYPKNTTTVYSNMTARSSRYAPGLREIPAAGFDNQVVVFGLQMMIKDQLIDSWNRLFFSQPKEKVVRQYKRRMDNALGKGAIDVQHIADLHDLGYLPIRIKALPEGSVCPIKVPFMTIVNTHPDFGWLTNYLETSISASMWKPLTVATIARGFRKIISHYAEMTGTPAFLTPIQGHDFSYRGLSNTYDAANMVGHLVSFVGTDTVAAIDIAEDYYGADSDQEMVGISVPATEHSVMCMGGKLDELETYRRLIEDEYPSGIVSIVSDTWDLWRVLTDYTVTLKDKILARKPDANGLAKVVFRPDSGDPVKIICGDPDAPVGSPAHKGAVECLWEIFGGTVTETGHKLLDSHVGLIYGDSITLDRCDAILAGLAAKGFSSGCMVFGIGSFTYQGITRDTFGMAIKATYGVVDGEARDLIKDPITDDGQKKSASGLLRVEMEDGRYVLHDKQTWDQEAQGALKTVFEDGLLVSETTLGDVRERLWPTA